MKKINIPNLNTQNQETPDLTDFLGFSQKMQDEGVISRKQYDAVLHSSENNTLKSYIKLFLEIEVGFWSIMIPTIIYTSRDDFSQSASSLMIEYAILSIGATTLRGSIAYWRARSHGLSHSSSFALLEIVPKIGRLAPVLWLPEHRDYLVMLMIHKKYRNKEYSQGNIEKDIKKYRSKIDRLQKIRYTIDTSIERVRNIF